ncbi:hypothetical protein O7614_15465 [Micromonospora sp. WMMD961]|uniref:hypothetical protein n=1 Tax=Micromonospora sp. WMMD961 TaxID=3016100 RepID=UPI002417CECC|nr:hypothetical protein [Micromonospora sp. WMMD961]MDG4781045.1 hypothetical protein [Micromonospora sp. WMMD961]
MRRLPVLMLGLLLVVPAGCRDASDPAADTDVAAQSDVSAGSDAVPGTAVPPCPLTAKQVSTILGQPLTDDGNCLFGDGKGVASVNITTSSPMAGSTTYEYARQRAGETFDAVKDLASGVKAYVAVKDIAGEAVLVSEAGAYTINLSSFARLDPAGYEQALRALLDAIEAT